MYFNSDWGNKIVCEIFATLSLSACIKESHFHFHFSHQSFFFSTEMDAINTYLADKSYING